MARDDLHFRLRIPQELKDRIEEEARFSHRSMTAEIITRLEGSFGDQMPVSSDMFSRIAAKAMAEGTTIEDLYNRALEEAFPKPKSIDNQIEQLKETIDKIDAEELTMSDFSKTYISYLLDVIENKLEKTQSEI